MSSALTTTTGGPPGWIIMRRRFVLSAQSPIARERSATAASPIREVFQSLDRKERNIAKNFLAAYAPTIRNNAERQTCASKPWNDSDMISRFVMIRLPLNSLPQRREMLKVESYFFLRRMKMRTNFRRPFTSAKQLPFRNGIPAISP